MTEPKVRPKISTEHLEFLEGQAITRDVLRDAGVYTLYDADDLPKSMRLWPGRDGYPGLAFPWRGYDGAVLTQVRPETPIKFDDGHVAKYVFPKGCEMILTIHPWMDELVDTPTVPLMIIEGTKQYLAAVSALGKDSEYALVGMPGCYGWKQHRKPLPDLGALAEVLPGRSVYLGFDADWKHNRDVFEAAKALTDLLLLYGVTEVRYVAVPGQGTEGLDDVLANVPDKREALLSLLRRAETKLPLRPPPRTQASDFTDEKGHTLRQKVVETVLEMHEMALAPDGSIMIYQKGVYQLDISMFKITKVLSDILGDRFTVTERASLIAMLQAELADLGRVVPPNPISPWVNLPNGMLDPRTLELHPHDPKLLSITQLPIEWDPEAICPTYDAWLEQVIGDQAELLHQVLAQMLAPQERPTKALFEFGPSRSGKSTSLRIARRIAGDGNTASETLHSLTSDKFAKANLYGKVLNTAADLSAKRVSDLSTFKMLTGDDSISAQFKGKQHFEYVNRAVICFSSNEPPTVNEGSNAYRVRLAKIAFDRSFEGAEDPTIEARIMASELPGVLVRIARAGQARFAVSGFWAPERASATAAFEQYSDSVARWLSEEKTIVTHLQADRFARPGEGDAISAQQWVSPRVCSTLTDLHKNFVDWADENHEDSFGKVTLGKRLDSIDGVLRVRITGARGNDRGLNIVDMIYDDVDHPTLSSTTSLGKVGKVGIVEEGLATQDDEVRDQEASQAFIALAPAELKPTMPVPVAAESDPLPVVEARITGMHQRVYDMIVADPPKAREKKIREVLGISATEYQATRDRLLSIGVIAKRIKGLGFDVTGDLVRIHPPYEQPDPTRSKLRREAVTSIYDLIPDPVCVDCGTNPGPRNAMLPHCPDCLIPFDLDVETP